ncbi:MAG: VWA domain-containing protein [Clostridia bacterium]|nr:VWA domain-containing protein [Clostridia bacterium]
MKKKKFFIAIAIIILIAIVGGLILTLPKLKNNEIGVHTNESKLDNRIAKGEDVWEYNPQSSHSDGSTYSGRHNPQSVIGATSESTTLDAASTSSKSSVSSSKPSASNSRNYSASDSYLGYSVGGANNAKNFRENIKNGYLPLSTDITYNGIYSEYYFDTGVVNRDSDELFYPSYSMAVSTNPVNGEKEYYMSVGLNSNIKESDFNRKKLNLVIVLDISGSMSSSFSSYYYDKKTTMDQSISNKTKMKIAEECVNSLIDQLNPDDRIGIVLFDDQAYIGCKLVEIEDTDTETLKSHILEVEPVGGTNFSSGYEMATELYGAEISSNEYQNRIIVITDAMPNLGVTSTDGMTEKIKKNSDNKIYTTFVGVGVDFNTKYTEGVSDVRGFNYYSVHSAEEFKKILTDEFDYMVTPLVYDLDLSFKSDCYEITNVYGSDSVNKSTGNIMHVNTLFPSSSNDDGDVKGGIIVLKLKKIKKSDNAQVELNVSYKDTEENSHQNSKKVSFKDDNQDYYDNLGIRKAIVLARYVGTMKNWTIYEKTKYEEFKPSKVYDVTDFAYEDEYVKRVLGVNERTSIKITISEEYKETFRKLKDYMEQENIILKDNDMENEIEILDKLI